MVRRRDRKPVDATGRNHTAFGRDNAVLIIRRSLWQSPLVSALSPAARALMVELLSMYNGSNNGRIFLSLKDATDRLGFSDWRAAAAAFDELEKVELITKTVEGYFDLKAGLHSRARAWQLNWIGEDGDRLAPDALPPVNERAIDPRARKRLQRRQGALKRYFKEHSEGKFAAVDSTTLDARRPENTPTPSVVSTMLKIENAEKPPIGEMVETTVYLSYHGDVGSEGTGWWNADRAMNASLAYLSVLLAAGGPELANILPPKNRAAQIRGSIRCENEMCGEPFSPAARGLPQRFCSERCRKRVERQRARKRESADARAERLKALRAMPSPRRSFSISELG